MTVAGPRCTTLLPCLTYEVHTSTELRQQGSNVPSHDVSAPIELEHFVTPSKLAPTSNAVPAPLPAAGKTAMEIKKEVQAELSIDDKIDEMRLAMPAASTDQLKKLLDECAGDMHQAIIAGQSQGLA